VNKRLFSAVLVVSYLLAASAQAAPVFMLQFGSFESKEEADKRLAELKTQHTGVLKSLPSGIREVSLPPDNLTVYRTQAGPLNSREEAQGVCAQLASNGDECYVVETAMLTPLTPPSTQVAAAETPAPAAATEAAPLPSPTLATSMGSGSTVSPQAAPPITMSAVAPRDPQNEQMIARATTPMAAGVSPASSTSTVSPEMQSAMDKAASQQASVEANLTPTQPAPAPLPVPMAATAPAPVAAEAPPAAPLPWSANASAPVTVAAAEPAPEQSETMPMLPPPPAPLMARAPSSMPMAAAPAPVIVPQTTGSIESAPLPPAASNGTPFKSGPSVAAGGKETNMPTATTTPPVFVPAPGNVTVAEAQRVPLSELNNVPIAPVTGSVASPIAPSMPVISLKPSSTLGQKTLWAQVGYFRDTQSALSFWENYRRTHPDFPVVRVRVTQPFQIATRGLSNVSLRVGPFARQGSINNLCTTIANIEGKKEKGIDGIRCGMVRDMGISSSASGKGFLPDSRYSRGKAAGNAMPFAHAQP
jgi:hypothetical protein